MSSLENADFRKATALLVVLALGLTFSPVALSSQIASAPESQRIDINHDPLACMTPILAPEVDAAVAPGPEFEKGYVYFRAAGTEDYYYAKLDGVPATLVAVLPRPLPETRAVDYYLRAFDLQTLSKKKGDFTPPVVPGKTCTAKGVAVGPNGAGLTIGLTKENQNPIPPGFNPKDIVKVILVTGVIVSIAEAIKTFGTKSATAGSGSSATGAGATAGGAAAAGGISTGVIVAAGAAVAAGVAVAASSKGGSNPTAAPTVTPTATPTPVIPRFLEAEVTWSGVGDIDVQMLSPSGLPVGQTFPAGCESTASRTERVILQGSLATGTYRIVLKGNSCGVGTPATISAVLSVLSESGPKCSNIFVSVPVGGSVDGCQFTLP